MMRFDIMTLFPALVDTVLGESIIGRAQKSGAIAVHTHNIRDYTEDKHRRVDDTPYGGGKGMLMMAPPIYNCYTAILEQQKSEGFEAKARRVIYLSPTGKVLNQARAAELARDYDNLILLCGHYEGVDQRALDLFIDEEISIGDYVLTGGELPAMVVADCVSRYVDGVISNSSLVDESFSENLLEYPQYTRPQEYKGLAVPEVLRSGDHAKIDAWRREKSLEITKKNRPDLLK